MNKSELISIIVPVYNAAPYLDKCISSILAQTHRNIELILVNDGSTDNSLEVCRAYAQKDPRIKVLTQENRGLGATRNAGLAQAAGAYIGFVDSDDYIAPNMMQTLLENALSHGADFVGAGYYQAELHSDKTEPFFHVGYPFDTPIHREKLMELLRDVHSGNLLWFCCRNLYRKTVLDRVGLRFSEENVIEDSLFNLEYLANCDSMVLIREPLYYYVMTPGSIIRKPGKKNYLRKLERSHDLKIAVYQKYGITGYEKSIADYSLNHTLTLLISNLLDLKQELRQEVQDIIRSPMIRTGFALGTLDASNTPLLKLFKFLIRCRAAAACVLLVRLYQFLRKR